MIEQDNFRLHFWRIVSHVISMYRVGHIFVVILLHVVKCGNEAATAEEATVETNHSLHRLFHAREFDKDPDGVLRWHVGDFGDLDL